jgi:hypothetical protein
MTKKVMEINVNRLRAVEDIADSFLISCIWGCYCTSERYAGVDLNAVSQASASDR